MSRVWTRDELATLRTDLSEIAATVAVEAAFWRPSRAARQASRAGRPRLAVVPPLASAIEALLYDWRRLALHVGLPAVLFGVFAAARPLGIPSFGTLQVVAALVILAGAMAFGWEEVIRERLGLGAGTMNVDRLLRIAKIAGFMVVVILGLGFSVFFATALLPSLGIPHTGVLDALLAGGAFCVAGPLLFHVASLAAGDERQPAETHQLLSGNILRFAAGSVATLAPFLFGLALIPTVAATPVYAFGAVGAAGLMLIGGLIHAGFLAEVYREVG